MEALPTADKHASNVQTYNLANGLDKRFNQTLQNMLVKYVSANREQWSSYLNTRVFAYSTTRQESSKYNPFFLTFGHRATLPVDINFHDESASEKYRNYNELEDPDISTALDDWQNLLEQVTSFRPKQSGRSGTTGSISIHCISGVSNSAEKRLHPEEN